MYQSNPAGPELIDKGIWSCPEFFLGVKGGYQFDRVFDWRMAVSNVRGHVHESKMLANQGVVTLNFFDRAEIYGQAGAAYFHFVDDIKTPGEEWQRVKFKKGNNWIWGVGGRASFLSWGNVTLGGSGGYQRSEHKIHYTEWQIGLGLAYQAKMLAPYIGGTFHRVNAHFHVPRGSLIGFPATHNIRMHNRLHYGVTVGCDFSPHKYIDVGAEFRMISETALTVKADIKF